MNLGGEPDTINLGGEPDPVDDSTAFQLLTGDKPAAPMPPPPQRADEEDEDLDMHSEDARQNLEPLAISATISEVKKPANIMMPIANTDWITDEPTTRVGGSYENVQIGASTSVAPVFTLEAATVAPIASDVSPATDAAAEMPVLQPRDETADEMPILTVDDDALPPQLSPCFVSVQTC